ncbi:MAG: CDP-alcohol phosphatidyltransferase family protein [Gemmatimonadaceae bacterium]|jgi:phosphatidylglycerophosphate synthase|nr:CDP-alcohol phosphatidyltransferase family protein [Gemmatimonadaceae bacterium]
MFDAVVRRALPSLLHAPVTWLVRRGVSPNAVSIVAVLLALGAAVLVALGHAWWGIALWLLSRLADALDGLVARASGGASAFGGYLDITLDMVAYGAMVIAFALVHPTQRLLLACVLFGYLLVTTTTLALSSILEREALQRPENDRSLQFTPGYAEAGETSAVYVLWTVLPSLFAPIGWAWVVLCLATAVQRTVLAHALLVRRDNSTR